MDPQLYWGDWGDGYFCFLHLCKIQVQASEVQISLPWTQWRQGKGEVTNEALKDDTFSL
jgi:hypothetical protein